jgi:PAS domain-containing protein
MGRQPSRDARAVDPLSTDPSGAQWAARVRRLEGEIAGLRRAMRTRGLIEQAKGMLAERLAIDPEEAFDYLSRQSQHANARVVDVASDIIGTARPTRPDDDQPPAAPTDEAIDDRPRDDGRRCERDGAGPETRDLPPALARRLRHVVAAVDAAPSISELPEAVAGSAEKTSAVCVFGLEPDGGLRVLAARGWEPRLVADWRHVPSPVATVASRAAQQGHPLWIDGTREVDLILIGPGPRRAALPLRAGDDLVGVLELVWPDAEPFDDDTRRYLVAVAAAVGRRLGRLAESPTEPFPLGGRRLEALLDGLVAPAQLLLPVRDAGSSVTDFVLGYANTAALRAAGHSYDFVGRRLLDLEPGLATNGVFEGLVRAYEYGVPLSPEPTEEIVGGRRVLVCRQAARVGNRLLATWHELDSQARTVQHLERMEVLGGFGWADWDLVSGEIYWSPGLYRLLGRDPARGPVPAHRLGALVLAEDLPAAEAGLHRVLREGVEAAGEIRLHRDDAVRTVRLVAEPRLDHLDRPTAVLALAQDVTDARRRDAQLNRAGEQLASQRIRFATEQAHTEELRRLLYPSPDRAVDAGRLRLLARHVAPKSIPRFRGDFYDITPIEDGAVVTLGDVFGSGASAATAVARLRHAARVLCLAGLGPATVLNLLNEELARDVQPPMASLVVARFTQESVIWAQAGHYAPIRLRDGRGRSLRRPAGLALGLIPDARYTDARLGLREDDTMIFYTDGLISALDRDNDPVSSLVRGFGRAWREGGAAAVLDGFLRPTEDEACVVAVTLRGPSDAAAGSPPDAG